METVAACLLGLYAAGSLVLGGAGLGLGMLLRFLGGTDAERRRVLAVLASPTHRTAGWLAGTAVALVGCFPGLARALVAGLWPIPALLAAGWLVRAVGLRRRGQRAVPLGSWLLAGGLAWALASLLVGGVHRTDEPAGWCAAAAVLLLFVTHGLGAGTRRLTGEPFRRARQLAGPRAGGRSVALTSTVLAVLPPLAGARLPLSDHAAPTPVLTLLVPPLLVLLVVQTLRLRPRTG